ncbi:MAG: GIY-YIG nuclease family protein [Patescibacteria group bacterium]|nr:GIY-YIG nuclease family protein [Patescibacteria group bacterium]
MPVAFRRYGRNSDICQANRRSKLAYNMKGTLYILQSLKNNTYYIGSTSDLINRFKQHNSGSVKATKHKKPYKLVFKQEFENMIIAHKMELKLKKWKRKDFIAKIIEDGEIRSI